MKYALVKIPHEGDKKVVVETCHIKNFSTFNFLTQNHVYRYDNGVEKFKCIVLHQSDSRDDLLEPKFRIREPVITNRSSLESSSDEIEAESEITKAKEARKKRKQNEIKSKKQKIEAIMKVYEANKKSNNKKTSDDTSGEYETHGSTIDYDTTPKIFPELIDNYNKIEYSSNSPIHKSTSEDELDFTKKIKRKKPIEETESEDEFISEPEHDYVEPQVIINNIEDDQESVDSEKFQRKPTSPHHERPMLKEIKNLEPNPLVSQLLKEIRKKDEEIIKLKRQLQQYRLTMASNQPKQQQQRQQQQQQQKIEPYKRYDPYHYIDNDTFHVGDSIYIPSCTFREAFDAPSPSKFIKTMSLAIWGIKSLSERVVREQKNTIGRTQLTPRKKELLKIHYRKYLENQKYSDEKFNTENSNSKINTYLDRAIYEAKRQRKKFN